MSFGIICNMLFACNAYSNNTTNGPVDFVAFFKQALYAPPDVERYTVSQHAIDSGSTSYYVGARSGSNYFLQMASDSNALLKNSPDINHLVGRSGNNVYGIGEDNVSYGIGSNAMIQNSDVMFQMTRQFLDMGASEINPTSVTWTGDKFNATLDNGHSRYGRLSVSNGLPFRLEIGVTKDSQPYKMVEYSYSVAPESLGGFPSRMLISDGPPGKLKPVAEVLFYSVKIADQPLSGDFFAASQFMGVKITHTNVYSNADLYAVNRIGQMVKLPASVVESGGYTNSRARAIVFLFFLLSIVGPVVFFVLRIKIKNKNEKEKL